MPLATAHQDAFVSESPRVSYVQPGDPWLTRQVVGHLEVLLGRRKVESIYHALKAGPFDPRAFFEGALERAQIDIDGDLDHLDRVPTTGPVVFVANHPFGVVDGLILCHLALKARRDFRILIHAMLCQDRDLATYFLPIDFRPNKSAQRNNIESKRTALACLAQDIPVLIFPSGMVSTADRLGFGSVADAPWSTFVAKLVRESQATVVPVHFQGRNSRKFHVASHIAEPMRMALLVHEALNKFGHTIRVNIGEPLSWAELSGCESRQALTDYLYYQVQALAHH